MRSSIQDTIVALATPPGVGAIAIIRLSGPDAIHIANKVFRGKNLSQQASHTVHFGTIREEETIIDEVLATVFIAPKSFTKENSVEISCHGSNFIVREIIRVLIQAGARLAEAGEYTKRAFLNGKFDLAQAEAVADLIHSDSHAAHQAALNQMRGGFSLKISELREQLIHFASMIELELDFGEEDVEFASRDALEKLVNDLLSVINPLIDSFQAGNVIKNGVPTVIAGKPNAGKSTLLNALLNEEKAIVSEIAGTTRDFIEDEMNIGGIVFRFTDTAGLRETQDKIEAMGVARTKEKMRKASLIIYMFDLSNESITQVHQDINQLENMGIPFLIVGNKLDAAQPDLLASVKDIKDIVLISAENKSNIEDLKKQILSMVQMDNFASGNTVVTNIRHYDSLLQTRQALHDVLTGLANIISNDFLAMDIRQALHHLGTITGQITTDDLLANIFSKFCIGK